VAPERPGVQPPIAVRVAALLVQRARWSDPEHLGHLRGRIESGALKISPHLLSGSERREVDDVTVAAVTTYCQNFLTALGSSARAVTSWHDLGRDVGAGTPLADDGGTDQSCGREWVRIQRASEL